MEWTRTETVAVAKQSCTQCHGLGLRRGPRGKLTPCNCALRAIFRACYARFRYCVTKEKYISRVSLEFVSGRERRLTWGRKDEEYVADFCLVSRRALSGLDYKVFKYHFLFGADWKFCTRRLNIDRGNFFHAVYRIEHRLGHVFRDLEPYSLFPLDEYFHGNRRNGAVITPPLKVVDSPKTAPAHRALRPPLLKAA